MTKNKRFQWVYIQEDVVQLRDNGIVKHFPPQRLEELLNELNDENEQLKQRNNFLKKQLDRVCSENEIMGDKLKQIGRML